MPRVILVTGGARGLGKSIANLFLQNNDIVYLSYNQSKKAAEEISLSFSNARIIKCDITNEQEIKAMIEVITKEEGHLDVLINNAAIALDNDPFLKTKEEFLKTLDTNLVGPFLLSKYASKIMPDNSSIINIASTNGLDTYYPYSIDYDASKSGLISLTHNLATYFAPKIRVNCIAPGWINTDMNKSLEPSFIANEKSKIMLNRFANPEEIAEVVFFVASPKASYINNAIIRVDGGTK